MSEPARTVAPTREDPLVRALSEVVGGVAGRHGGRAASRLFRPERILMGLLLVSGLLMVLAKQHCRSHGFEAPGMYYHMCYSDVPALYAGRGIAQGAFPYLDVGPWQPVEYPVLTGLAMWLTGWVTRTAGGAANALLYFDVNILATLAWLAVTVWATARTVARRPWDAAMVALAPGVVLAATINWDMWAVGFTALSTLAWSRRRPALAGALLGLGVAAKFYPLLLIGPLLLLCWRAGRMREFWRATLTAAAVWLVVNAPFMFADFATWSPFYRMSAERGAGFGSIWLVLSDIGHPLPTGVLNLASGLLLASACVGIAVVAMTARRRPRLAQLGLLVLAAFVVTNKVYSPQYVVWLIPFAVMARPRWRDFIIWQAAEVVHFAATWLFIAGYTNPTRAMPVQGYDLAVGVHVLATLWLAGMVVRDIYRPEGDPVRADGSDDPAGGVLDGAPDVRVWRPGLAAPDGQPLPVTPAHTVP